MLYRVPTSCRPSRLHNIPIQHIYTTYRYTTYGTGHPEPMNELIVLCLTHTYDTKSCGFIALCSPRGRQRTDILFQRARPRCHNANTRSCSKGGWRGWWRRQRRRTWQKRCNCWRKRCGAGSVLEWGGQRAGETQRQGFLRSSSVASRSE